MNKLLESIDNLKSFAIHDNDLETKETVIFSSQAPIASISLYYGEEMTCIAVSDINSFNVFDTPSNTRIGFLCFELNSVAMGNLDLYLYRNLEINNVTQITADLSNDTKEIYDIEWARPYKKVIGDSYIIIFECKKQL